MGLLVAFLSALFMSFKDMLSKRLSFDVDGSVSAFASFLYALPFYALVLVVLWFAGREPFEFGSAFITLVVLRSFTDAFAELCKMHSFTYGDISLVSAFHSLSPLFLLVTSPLITGDPITLRGSLGIVLIVAGSLLLLYRPRSNTQVPQAKAVLFAIAAAFFFSLNSCFDRLAVQQASPVLAGFAMTAVAALFLLLPVARSAVRRRDVVLQWRTFTIRGMLEVLFMVLKLTALQYLQAPYVSGIQRSSMLVSIVGGRVIFKETDFARRFASGFLILLGVSLIILETVSEPSALSGHSKDGIHVASNQQLH